MGGNGTGHELRRPAEASAYDADAELARLESRLHATRRGHFGLYLSARRCRELQLRDSEGMAQEEIRRIQDEVAGLDTSLLWLLEDELEECDETDGEKRIALTEGIEAVVEHSRWYW